jgi:hypothetical protein
MTIQELKDYILEQLTAPVNQVIKVINSFFAVIDFSTTQVSTIIPDWTNALTFNTDGSGAGMYCKHPDTDGKKRIFETKTDGNINNEPPTNPAITENTHWKEVSSSSSAAIPEWSPGLYGPGLIIVYHNHSVDGSGLYKLLEPVRPYNSVNIETEITAGDWEPIASGGGGGGIVIAATYANIAALLADQANQEDGLWYMVDDASADATVDTGWAIYEKLAATTGAITDYIKRAEQESLDITFPDWSDTTKGKVERSTQAEAEAIATQAAAGSTTGLSDDRTPSEIGLYHFIRNFVTKAWTWTLQQIFTAAPRFNSTTASQFLKVDGNKDLESVAGATAAEAITGTDTTKPLTASSMEGKHSIKRASAAVSSGTMTLDIASKEEIRFEDTTARSSNFTIAFSSESNAEFFEVNVPITGTVVITLPSSVVMQTSDLRWNNGAKTLTVVGTTASPFILIFSRISSTRFELAASYAYNAS